MPGRRFARLSRKIRAARSLDRGGGWRGIPGAGSIVSYSAPRTSQIEPFYRGNTFAGGARRATSAIRRKLCVDCSHILSRRGRES